MALLQRRTASLEGEALLRAVDILNQQLTAQGQTAFLRMVRDATAHPGWHRLVRSVRAGRGLSDSTLDEIDSIALNTEVLQGLWTRAFSMGGKTASRIYENVVHFDPRNPRVREVALTTGSARIQEIATSTRNSIRQYVADSLRSGVSASDLADTLRPHLGLTFQQTQAVAAMRERLLSEGLGSSRANRRASQYAQQLLSQRAATIAETEMTYALELGKMTYWEDAINSGLLNRDDVEFIWVAENDERLDVMCALVDGQAIKEGQFFNTSIGPVLTPPLHPRCRCQVIMGSSKQTLNYATRSDDARLTQGQTTNRFTNPISGATIGKTETGDIWEQALMDSDGRMLLTKRFNGRPYRVAGVSERRNVPLDVFIDDARGNTTHVAEVKTMHVNSGNLKTAIKKDEYVRKLAVAIDTDEAYAISDRVSGLALRGLDKPTRDAVINEAFDEIKTLRANVGVKRTPVTIVQVVDDTKMFTQGPNADTISVRVLVYENDFPSKSITKFEEIGSYRITPRQLEEAVLTSGHGGAKMEARALQELWSELGDITDTASWHPLNTIDGTPNPAIKTVMSWATDRPTGVKPIWEMTEREARDALGDMAGIQLVEQTKTHVAEAWPHLGKINVHPEFWKVGTPATRFHVMMHEVGHSLETYVMSNTRLRLTWTRVIETVKESGMAIDARGKAESLAEAYGLLWSEPAWLRNNFPTAYRFIREVAESIDFPLPTGLAKSATERVTGEVDCATDLPAPMFDMWGEEIEEGDWYIEMMDGDIWLVPFIIEEWGRL